MTISVYLSGPITGVKNETISAWRDEARGELSSSIEVIDPTRQFYDPREYFGTELTLKEQLTRADHGKLVVHRNRNDINRASLLLANFVQSPDRVSIGSVGEIHWAYAYGTPIVIVRQAKGNVHDHAMLNAMSMHITDSLHDACAFVNQVFGRE